MRGSNFSYLAKQGLVSVWRNRMMSFGSFCIIMVSLLLISLAVLIGFDINRVIGNAEEKSEILVYVDDADEADLTRIEERIRASADVSNITFYSKEEAWEQKKQEYEDFEELFDAITENPLPDTFRVTLADISQINAAKTQFELIDGVESVSAPYDYAQVLISLRTTLSVIGVAVMAALIIVCIVIVYNAERTSVFVRRKEIGIMKSVGATNFFIKFPFFIEGMFIGIIAGAAAWILTKFSYEALVSLFAGDITIWQIMGLVNLVSFDDIMWIALLLNCAAGALLGALGTIFSMRKHLKV